MICTEDEARTKWCPFARDPPAAPGQFDGLLPNRCMASACMVWRWQATVLGLRKGFCGLAGRSE